MLCLFYMHHSRDKKPMKTSKSATNACIHVDLVSIVCCVCRLCIHCAYITNYTIQLKLLHHKVMVTKSHCVIWYRDAVAHNFLFYFIRIVASVFNYYTT